MTKVSDITDFIEKIAPLRLAEDWDPVGLQIGDPQQPVKNVLICIDMTTSLIKLSENIGIDLVITHHPLIFSPLQTVRADNRNQSLIYQLIRNNISVYSAHTNLDAAAGGVADSLAFSLELETKGWHTVMPLAGSNEVAEKNITEKIIHETEGDTPGHGRYAVLDRPISFNRLRQIVIQKLGSSGCRINTDHDKEVEKIAVFPGSFDESWIDRIVELGIDTIITGECKHHVSIALAQIGVSLLEAGHDVTERVVLLPLADRLRENFKQISFVVDTGLDYNKMAF